MLVYKLHSCSASAWAKNVNFSVTDIYLRQKHWHSSVILCYIEQFKPNTSKSCDQELRLEPITWLILYSKIMRSVSLSLNTLVTVLLHFLFKLNTAQFYCIASSMHFSLPVVTSPLIFENDQLVLKMYDIWPHFHVPPSMNKWVTKAIYVKLKKPSSNRRGNPETPIP